MYIDVTWGEVKSYDDWLALLILSLVPRPVWMGLGMRLELLSSRLLYVQVYIDIFGLKN